MTTSADGSAADGGDPAARPFFHEGMRAWQDRFDSRRLAGRLEERLGRNRFTADDRAFIESRTMFFLATADGAGQPDRSYKGGDAGFVRVRATHIFPTCPRYIHRMQLAETSPYVPRPRVEPPVPAWKRFEAFSDVLPREDRSGGRR